MLFFKNFIKVFVSKTQKIINMISLKKIINWNDSLTFAVPKKRTSLRRKRIKFVLKSKRFNIFKNITVPGNLKKIKRFLIK